MCFVFRNSDQVLQVPVLPYPVYALQYRVCWLVKLLYDSIFSPAVLLLLPQVCVQGIPWKYTWKELKDLLAECGEVERADVMTAPDGRSKVGHCTDSSCGVVLAPPAATAAAAAAAARRSWSCSGGVGQQRLPAAIACTTCASAAVNIVLADPMHFVAQHIS